MPNLQEEKEKGGALHLIDTEISAVASAEREEGGALTFIPHGR